MSLDTLPLELIAPFDSLLRDDPSDANLLIWADALEDAGDEACRGVREFLVGNGHRPLYKEDDEWERASWWGYEPHCCDASDIGHVLLRLTHWSLGNVEDKYCIYPRDVHGPHYYTIALYDAAQAWCAQLAHSRKG